jgi:hypothetical protein
LPTHDDRHDSVDGFSTDGSPLTLIIDMGLYLLDYGAGNVQSLANSLSRLGHDFEWITSPEDFDKATVTASSFPDLSKDIADIFC